MNKSIDIFFSQFLALFAIRASQVFHYLMELNLIPKSSSTWVFSSFTSWLLLLISDRFYSCYTNFFINDFYQWFYISFSRPTSFWEPCFFRHSLSISNYIYFTVLTIFLPDSRLISCEFERLYWAKDEGKYHRLKHFPQTYHPVFRIITCVT